MGELLHLYLGDDEASASRAFWVGASRLFDSRPLLSQEAADAVAAALPVKDSSEADAWSEVATELHEALVVATSK